MPSPLIRQFTLKGMTLDFYFLFKFMMLFPLFRQFPLKGMTLDFHFLFKYMMSSHLIRQFTLKGMTLDFYFSFVQTIYLERYDSRVSFLFICV